jgi:sphingomyelin phosphodiesterase
MTPKSKDQLIKIVLMSDIHMSFDYVPGMSNKCEKVLCCRSDSGPPSNVNETAGFWGDYKCDIPPWTFQEVLKEIREV